MTRYGEVHLCTVTAARKGRSRAPCTLKVGYLNDAVSKEVVLRTIDAGGVAPIVALLSAADARHLAAGLVNTADLVERR
ncbi:hypothetical protein ACFL09_00745 [Planctomycetota bacterium]